MTHATAGQVKWTRIKLVACAAATVAAGLVLRFGLPRLADGPVIEFLADLSGSVLYTVLWFVLVRFLSPALCNVLAALWAFGISAAIELLQLTPFPSAAAEFFAPSALVFGTIFNPGDLLGYAFGALAGALIFGRLGRPPNA